jgi:Phage integrase family
MPCRSWCVPDLPGGENQRFHSGRAKNGAAAHRRVEVPDVRGVAGEGRKTGKRVPPPGAVPTFHGFRHSAASEAIAAGDGAEEVSWQLGHKNSNVTRAVYIHEIKDAEKRARRRAKVEARYGSVLEAADRSATQQPASQPKAKVVDLGAFAAGGSTSQQHAGS